MNQEHLHECRCEFDGRICNSKQEWSNDKCQCECKKPMRSLRMRKYYICIRSTCSCKCNKDCDIGKYLKDCTCMESIVDNLAVT